MDETPAYFDIVASKSVDKVGVKQCVIRSTGAEKRHLTVVLTVTAFHCPSSRFFEATGVIT